VRTLATNEPTFSASKIALEVMRANEEEFKGNSQYICSNLDMSKIF
jgi:hypothetical protein